jgi:hypothetical protein
VFAEIAASAQRLTVTCTQRLAYAHEWNSKTLQSGLLHSILYAPCCTLVVIMMMHVHQWTDTRRMSLCGTLVAPAHLVYRTVHTKPGL